MPPDKVDWAGGAVDEAGTFEIGAEWYNHLRSHTGRDHLLPVRDRDDPPVVDLANHKLVCRSELSGHLNSYRAAA